MSLLQITSYITANDQLNFWLLVIAPVLCGLLTWQGGKTLFTWLAYAIPTLGVIALNINDGVFSGEGDGLEALGVIFATVSILAGLIGCFIGRYFRLSRNS